MSAICRSDTLSHGIARYPRHVQVQAPYLYLRTAEWNAAREQNFIVITKKFLLFSGGLRCFFCKTNTMLDYESRDCVRAKPSLAEQESKECSALG
jgi:hypothetical protein